MSYRWDPDAGIYVPNADFEIQDVSYDPDSVDESSLMWRMFRGVNERRWIAGGGIYAYTPDGFQPVQSLNEAVITKGSDLQSVGFWRFMQEQPQPFSRNFRGESFIAYPPDSGSGYSGDIINGFVLPEIDPPPYRRYTDDGILNGTIQPGDIIGTHLVEDILSNLRFRRVVFMGYDNAKVRRGSVIDSSSSYIGQQPFPTLDDKIDDIDSTFFSSFYDDPRSRPSYGLNVEYGSSIPLGLWTYSMSSYWDETERKAPNVAMGEVFWASIVISSTGSFGTFVDYLRIGRDKMASFDVVGKIDVNEAESPTYEPPTVARIDEFGKSELTPGVSLNESTNPRDALGYDSPLPDVDVFNKDRRVCQGDIMMVAQPKWSDLPQGTGLVE